MKTFPLPWLVHLIGAPLTAVLDGAICIASARLLGHLWLVIILAIVAYVPAFIVAHWIVLVIVTAIDRIAGSGRTDGPPDEIA